MARLNPTIIQHICVLTTNKALAELAADIINNSPVKQEPVAVVAAQGSWAVKNILRLNSDIYALIDWKTLTLMGWEHHGMPRDFHLSMLSGPWMGDGA